MNILENLTKDFQYEESINNSEVRKLTSGPFRGVWVNRNGFCYSERNGKTLKISQGYYKSCGGHKQAIKPWRLCALVWHDQTPSLHLDDGDRDKYLNLLSFIKLLEKYPDEYELVIDGTKTNYYPLSQLLSINVLTGCLVRNVNIKLRFPTTYSEIKWDYFNEICEKTISDFHRFKDELSEELKKNLKGNLPKVTEDKEEDEEDSEEELEVCLSDPELGGAPSLKPKIKEDQSHSNIYHSDNSIQKENNKMEDYSNIPGYDPSKPMEAQENSVLDEIELRGYKDHAAERNKFINRCVEELIAAKDEHDHESAKYFLDKLITLGLSKEEIDERISSTYRHMLAVRISKMGDKEVEEATVSSSSSDSIEELQKLFDRRAQLKKELAEIENEIKEKLQ